MTRITVRTLVLLVVVTLLTTVIVAGDSPPPAQPEGAESPLGASGGASGAELALLCIVLGGGMIFLFRPKRRVVDE